MGCPFNASSYLIDVGLGVGSRAYLLLVKELLMITYPFSSKLRCIYWMAIKFCFSFSIWSTSWGSYSPLIYSSYMIIWSLSYLNDLNWFYSSANGNYKEQSTSWVSEETYSFSYTIIFPFYMILPAIFSGECSLWSFSFWICQFYEKILKYCKELRFSLMHYPSFVNGFTYLRIRFRFWV